MIYKILLPNFKYGHLTPTEDSFANTDTIFAVADGVTRDPSYDMNFKEKSFEEILKDYPKQSGAKFAADEFTSVFVKTIQKHKDVRQSFIETNKAIELLNKKYVPEPDYLVNDYYACVASGGYIENGILYWGVIGDCGVIVYDKEGVVKLKTPNPYAVFEDYVKKGKITFKWELAEGRKFVRSEFRNKPEKTIDGKRASFGVLTGEKEAEQFIYTGELRLDKDDLVVFYTDGFEPVLEDFSFFKSLYQNDENVIGQGLLEFDKQMTTKDPDKYGKERTLIAVKP